MGTDDADCMASCQFDSGLPNRDRVSSELPEVWAGVECTVNRIGDRYSDQLYRSGHDLRPRDLEELAGLGIRTLRYPILWERTAPQGLDKLEWSWADARMADLKRLNINPIVGLLHHGSGPRYTDLLDPEFPEKLAGYAGQVARRYEWVRDYTPVNEPLTTARFSCLYGHWYPHTRDALGVARALLAQCRGIILSMRAIRAINPDARLIQTEDLGKTFSTTALTYQAEFENERRWLTFDLLSGRLGPGSPMWEYLRWVGVEQRELEWFLDNRMAPDLLGVNHYITSERFLDERTGRYPPTLHGGNGRHRYADLEAVRIRADGVAGPKAILNEAWQRYHSPLAITEVHLGCSREEQMRWLNEVWNAALNLRSENVDVRAVTAWAAFGAFDWNTLLTSESGCYEPGIFDLRSPAPRATALAKMVRTLASGKQFDHPALDGPGWWRRWDRFSYPPVTQEEPIPRASIAARTTSGFESRCVMIAGATTTLGQAFARICEKRGLAYRLLSRQQLDITEQDSILRSFDDYQPWAIVNAGGYVRIDDAERQSEICMRENVEGPARLAKVCAERRIPLVTFSSDQVFDGTKQSFYFEGDECTPLNVYGKSKLLAERSVLEAFPDALVIRSSAFFSPWDRFNFVHNVLERLATGCRFFAALDITVSPTYVPDLVHAALDLLIDGESGIWHIANVGGVTWAEFAQLIAQTAGYDARRIQPCPGSALGFVARRPRFSALSSERGVFLPPFKESLDKWFHEKKWRLNVTDNDLLEENMA